MLAIINMKVYADNAATACVDGKVMEAVGEALMVDFGNPSSSHSVGRRARDRLELARREIAEVLGCCKDEIVFTSGGTEANNLAIRGVARANPEKRHIITSVIEHPCVLETVRELEKDGYEVDYVGVDSLGRVDVGDVERMIRDDTLLVSIMRVNNETGVVQDVEAIGRVCRGRGVLFHTDNVQGFLKKDLGLEFVDLMSVSGHKVCAPKGIGFLYVRDGVDLNPIITGGGQERGFRSGTENVAGAVGLAAALDVDFRIEEVRASRDIVCEGLRSIVGLKMNGDMENRVYNNLNFSVYGIEGEALMLLLSEEGIAVSTGSACASGKLQGSYVLKEMGVGKMWLNGSIRMTFGVDVLGNEEYVVERVRECVEKLQKMSPFKFAGEASE